MDALTIKVPFPFKGVSHLGFTTRYPEQDISEKLRDVPILIEGSSTPMEKLIDRLTLFSAKGSLFPIDSTGDDEAYSWTPPIQLTDELCVLSFQDHSSNAQPEVHSRQYIWNLIRPLVFTFLRDCVRIGDIQLNDTILLVVEPSSAPPVDLELNRSWIIPSNGTRLLPAA